MAANRQSVPKFGEWSEDVPFTIVFDKASRSSRKYINKSNPNEYPNMNPNAAQTRNQGHGQAPNHNVRPRHERFREETEFRPSPAHNVINNRVRAPQPTAETYNHQSYGGGGRNPSETNRRQPYDPTTVKPKPINNLRGGGSERVATSIPPFPGSASENENYTFIFDKVKEKKKQSETVRSCDVTDHHSTPAKPINDDQHHQPPPPSSPKRKVCICFLIVIINYLEII
ncbi:unnamed protein product [Eruca vesicaria subsp. sativa]|uniref:RIN4 pathogenic type III effector avirulence factor Avr cleavage site domain-containing protein n=1 Tax=Eruca vesicaria subsp. sativa TaxID=29727 RepID=A0ABC8L0A6_ERUVS|nr:unnamed protein product [Eruca vesicaria subsp. sativa]